MPDETNPTNIRSFAKPHNPDALFRYSPQILPKDPLTPYILGGSINLLVGSHQAGKTAMLGRLIRDWMSGHVLGQPVPEGAITGHGVLTTNRSWQHSDRLSTAFKDLPSPLTTYSLTDDATFDLKDFRTRTARVELFEKCLNQMGLARGSLLWVDPFALFLGSNLLDFDACAVSCLEIRKVLAARGLTLIATTSTAKPKADQENTYPRLLDRIYGTASQLSFVDTCLYLATPDERQRANIYTLQVYPQYAKMLTVDFIRTEDGTFEPAPPDAEFTQLLALLPFDGTIVSTATLADALTPKDMSRRTLYRTLRELVTLGRLVKVGHGKYARPQVAEPFQM